MQMRAERKLRPAFTPTLDVREPVAAWWLAQVTLRLRREMAWCWYQRGEVRQAPADVLPPLSDAALESLDFSRYGDEKARFFAEDVTARYLSDAMRGLPYPLVKGAARGSFGWVAESLALDEAACFVLALALAARVDAAYGPVCAAVQNDAVRPYPTLALAQRLWDDPLQIGLLADAGHPLLRRGLISFGGARNSAEWQLPLDMPAQIAHALLYPDTAPPPSLAAVDGHGELPPDAEMAMALARLQAEPPQHLQWVPLVGPQGADYAGVAGAASADCGRQLMTFARQALPERGQWHVLATLCWLKGWDLLLPERWTAAMPAQEFAGLGLEAMPLRCYLPVTQTAELQATGVQIMPALKVPALGYHERLQALTSYLPRAEPPLARALTEAARRFRFQHRSLERVGRSLASRRNNLTPEHVTAAFRAEAEDRLGHLAQRVPPRFALDDLVLPQQQERQLGEIVRAMQSLAAVHYGWGTARTWNEAGLSVMFCGPPGTGKTMAAEAIAQTLDLPLYRIDLSQVVNKYIGETEKNLKQLFDAAEESDTVLFFDEADALFGRRTEVRDAHDRFANIEISYLLQRMEAFQGLAILATNRRKDLDEAFTRRLRYIVEFPIPGEAERERIWRLAFPAQVDTAGIDFDFLARQFELSGGHIHSIAFNACLQCAADDAAGRKQVDMPRVLMALKRELEKMGRVCDAALFGVYAGLVED